ncbi:DNA pilot protein [Microvirus mar33]|uniref:DNA pilot protein n=1 Tax=Microvirus mar33 TaxID=2851167 RepID=A0A8F5RCR0_9VIRU|nr:DNA pilot protein [Microvirus mar33]
MPTTSGGVSGGNTSPKPTGIGAFFQGIGNYISTNAQDPLGSLGRVGELLSGKNFFDVYDKSLGTIFGQNSGKDVTDTVTQQDVQDIAHDIVGQQNALQDARDQADRVFAQDSANTAMDFEAREAEKLRQWQTDMSNTSYQRAVADLKKAGLSPLLMYSSGGSGASTPSGSAASGAQASHRSQSVDLSPITSLMNSYFSTARSIQTETMSDVTKVLSTLILSGAFKR